MTEPLSKAEQAAVAALGWRDRYVRATTNMQRASATLMLTEQLASIYGPAKLDAPAPVFAERFCCECVDPDEDPIAWCDCRSDEPPCRPPCKQNAHTPERCPRNPVTGTPRHLPLPKSDPPQWYARTMADVRPGDLIRPKPGAPSSEVTARCWPPTDDARGRGSWHVIEGSGGHWDDHVLQPGECCVHLDGAGHRLFRPTFGVEILLAPSEVQAIELLGGWEHRERMITE